METLAQVMGEAVQKGELAEASPALLASQFTALIKAETDALLLKQAIPVFTPAQIGEMVKRGVRLFSVWCAGVITGGKPRADSQMPPTATGCWLSARQVAPPAFAGAAYISSCPVNARVKRLWHSNTPRCPFL